MDYSRFLARVRTRPRRSHLLDECWLSLPPSSVCSFCVCRILYGWNTVATVLDLPTATHQGVHGLSGSAQEDRAVYSGYQGLGGAIASLGDTERCLCREHEYCRINGTFCPWRTCPTPGKDHLGQSHAPGGAGGALELMGCQGGVSRMPYCLYYFPLQILK